jgi:citrate lyase subunit beta / citryl-CoA lyase
MHPLPRRRSCLSVPGVSDKMMAKALTLDADEIILDLEDAVPPRDKAAARIRVATAAASEAWRGRTVSIRVNGLATPWGRDDIAAVARVASNALTLIIPKVETPSDIVTAADLAGAAAGLQALIETAKGVINAPVIAAASPQLQTLIVGYADLASSLGRPASSTASWRTVQDLVVIAARAHDLQPIDGPFFQFDAPELLKSEATRARDQGFEGKWAIHPAQLAIINETLTPTADEVDRARAVLDELRRTGGGASRVGDGMIDEAMRLMAERTLRRAGMTEPT